MVNFFCKKIHYTLAVAKKINNISMIICNHEMYFEIVFILVQVWLPFSLTHLVVQCNCCGVGVFGEAGSRTSLMNVLMQLRKCCNHPYLFDGVCHL